MRGLLHVARKTWTKTEPLPENKKMSTTQYIEQLRERIDKALASLCKYNSETNGDRAQCMMIVTDDIDETATGEDGLPSVVPHWMDGGATNVFTIG